MKLTSAALRRLSLLLVGVLTLSITGVSYSQQSAPTPYPDAKDESAWPGKGPIRVFGWMVENRNWFWTQREKDQNAIVFVGDSLTGGWKADAMKQAFPGLKIANRGIGGDVSRGVLFRLKEDVLDLKPVAIHLCIGTNDLSTHADPAIVEGNIRLILDQIRAYNPSLPVVISNIPPRDMPEAPAKPGAVADLNNRIKKASQDYTQVTYVDIHAALADAEGKPVAEYFGKDRLHLAAPGYAKWGEVLAPVIKALPQK